MKLLSLVENVFTLYAKVGAGPTTLACELVLMFHPLPVTLGITSTSIRQLILGAL